MPAKMKKYDDDPLLFITSTDARIPQGRNARAQYRSEQADKVPSAGGEFSTLDFSTGDKTPGDRAGKRQKRRETTACERNAAARMQALSSRGTGPVRSLQSSSWAISDPRTLPCLNPTGIVAVASLHVRRMAVLCMRHSPDRLSNILRCRQWSCIPYATHSFGGRPCADSAIVCIADRIRVLTGCRVSALSMMKHYQKALRLLQTALSEPENHDPQDILTAAQLLAVYEMMDSLDNERWSKHVAGAENIIQKYTTITPAALERCESNGSGQAFPMFGDALMKGNTDFFRTYPWRELLWATFAKWDAPPPGIQDLMQCLRLLPSLLIDVDAALSLDYGINGRLKVALLDRAHDVKYRMRSALSGNQLFTECNYRDMLSSFDLLGASLAGLVALDRMIPALRPTHGTMHGAEDEGTEELCVQLLQLELDASRR